MVEIVVTRLKPTKETINVESLTYKQYKYVSSIENYKAVHKKVPTIRTICELVGVNSPSTVFKTLELLQAKGYDYRIL